MESDRFIEIHSAKCQPEISFLMPVYQQALYVRAAVLSVLAQRGLVAEVLISDDGSSDNTFNIAYAAVLEWLNHNDCPHRIVVRRGSARLWRDHLMLLSDVATCDLVCQAHGDDLSHPNRGLILLSVFRNHPDAVLVASEGRTIDANGTPFGRDNPPRPGLQVRGLPLEVIIEGHQDVTGFSQAWRRRAVAVFPRLDTSRAVVSHDRILPFRSAIVGRVYLVEAQLVVRRRHARAASYLMFDELDTNGQFGWSVTRLVCFSDMRKDLDHARTLGLLTQEQTVIVSDVINRSVAISTEKMLVAYRQQLLTGRKMAWVEDSDLLKLRAGRT